MYINTNVIPSTASASLTSASEGIFDDINNGGVARWLVSLTATGSVTLQGSIDNVKWFNLPTPTGATQAAVSATALVVTALFPYLRAVITANTGSIVVQLAV